MASYPNTRARRDAANGSKRRRSAGEGSVYESADGRWRGAISWTEPDGSRHRRLVSGPTSADARHKLDVLRDKLRIGSLPSVGSGSVAA
jgi:hypothetical protein